MTHDTFTRAQSASNVARLHRRCIHFSTLPQVVHSAATNAPAEREPCWQSLTPRWAVRAQACLATRTRRAALTRADTLRRFPALRVPAPESLITRNQTYLFPMSYFDN